MGQDAFHAPAAAVGSGGGGQTGTSTLGTSFVARVDFVQLTGYLVPSPTLPDSKNVHFASISCLFFHSRLSHLSSTYSHPAQYPFQVNFLIFTLGLYFLLESGSKC